VAQRRRLIVDSVRQGESQRAVADRPGIGRGAVQRALARAGEERLDAERRRRGLMGNATEQAVGPAPAGFHSE
jgi:transposase